MSDYGCYRLMCFLFKIAQIRQIPRFQSIYLFNWRIQLCIRSSNELGRSFLSRLVVNSVFICHMERRLLTMSINHGRSKSGCSLFKLIKLAIGCAKHRFLQIYLLKGQLKMQQQKMEIQQDWKFQLRRQIYQQNLSNMPFKFTKQLNKQQEQLAYQLHNYHHKKDQRSIQSEDEDLTQYKWHPKLSFYIPIKEQVYFPTEMERILGKPLGNTSKISKKVEQMLMLLKLQKGKITVAQRWGLLMQKYICPLDILQKIDLYGDLKKYGTPKLQMLLLVKYPHLKPTLLLKSIISAAHYFQQKHLVTNIQQTRLVQYYCKFCNLYNCLVHLPEAPNTDQVSCNKPITESNRFYQTTDYSIKSLIQLLAQIRLYFFEKSATKLIKRQSCSKECYRNLDFKDIQKRYKQFKVSKDKSDFDKLKSFTTIFGYRPCFIAKVAQKPCATVLVILLLECQNNLINFGGIDQRDYLKRKSKFGMLQADGGCSCKKGQCNSNKCQCVVNNKECSPSTCLCQPVLSNLLVFPQFCLNQKVTSNNCPPLRIGISGIKAQKLGLFTMTPIKQGEIAFWISGQRITQACWNDLEEFLLNKSGQRSCNLIFGNINGKNLGGKYRFVCHGNPKDANVKHVVKWVNGVDYTIFVAVRNFQVDEELAIACRCSSLFKE